MSVTFLPPPTTGRDPRSQPAIGDVLAKHGRARKMVGWLDTRGNTMSACCPQAGVVYAVSGEGIKTRRERCSIAAWLAWAADAEVVDQPEAHAHEPTWNEASAGVTRVTRGQGRVTWVFTWGVVEVADAGRTPQHQYLQDVQITLSGLGQRPFTWRWTGNHPVRPDEVMRFWQGAAFAAWNEKFRAALQASERPGPVEVPS
jgi:hypothetical protein